MNTLTRTIYTVAMYALGAAALFALVASLRPAAAQEGGAKSMTAPSAAEYVKKAAIGDQFEIRSSQLALEKAENDEVREFAQMMIEDHTRSSEILENAVAESDANLQIPTSLDAEHQQLMEQLRGASGTSFDSMYIEIQSKAHEKGHKLHQGYAENGDDEALKDAASQIAPVIENHMQELKELKEQQT